MINSILIVDNDIWSNESIERAMKLLNIALLPCVRVAEALEILKNQVVQSILINTQTEDLDYSSVLCEIRKNAPHTSIILLSNLYDEEWEHYVSDGRADKYITKPVNFEALINYINSPYSNCTQ